jgi:antitoxin (DNA-binding transcriptional repressor) of toxin-antitoxin stability system
MNVRTRELKNRLSHNLRHVRDAGESIFVTDRGEIVAELRPVARLSKKSERDLLLALSARGDVSDGDGRFADFELIKPRRRVSVARIVLDDR